MTDIADLMARDPLELSKSPEDLMKIISYYREKRKAYLEGAKAVKKETKKKTAINLDDLGELV